MMQYSIEPRTRKYVKGYGFLSFATKYKKNQIKDQMLPKKVVHKGSEYLEKKLQMML